jgi:hypothetical protein
LNTDGEFNTLRVAMGDHSIAVWVNGEPACEDIEVERPFGALRAGVFGNGDETPFDCEFDSIRVWRAGEAPPPLK